MNNQTQMQGAADILHFKPPRPGRWGKPVVLALVAHALLMVALTWGVHWEKDEPQVAFEAEIWSALPREAAPRAVQAPPPPPPEPEQPKPEPKPVPPPPQPTVKQPDIATEKAKQKKIEEEKKVKLEDAKKEKAKKEQAERDKKELAEKKKADEKKLADQKKQAEERKTAERREAQTEKIRNDQLARMMGQAGASGGPEAKGTAPQSSGPSSGYAARVQAKVRPNIRALEDFPRSLLTGIEVRALPDGTITSRRVVQSSGNAAWDDTALKAVDRTGSLPRDVDGRVPSPIIIDFRPTD